MKGPERERPSFAPPRLSERQCSGTRRKVDVRLPGKGNSNSSGARPDHPIITMIKWFRTGLSIRDSLSGIPHKARNVSVLKPRGSFTSGRFVEIFTQAVGCVWSFRSLSFFELPAKADTGNYSVERPCFPSDHIKPPWSRCSRATRPARSVIGTNLNNPTFKYSLFWPQVVLPPSG